MDMRTYQKQRIRSEFKKHAGRLGIYTGFSLAVIWGFFWLPWLRVSRISADDFASMGEIKSVITPYLASLNSLWLPNNNFFLLKTSKLEQLLKEKGVGLAVAQKIFPAAIDIKFLVTVPWLIYCGVNDCFYVSEDGILSDRAPRFSTNPVPEILTGNNGGKLGDGIILPEEALLLRQVFQKLKQQNVIAASAAFGQTEEVKITTAENWYLLILKSSEIERIAGDIKLLLDQKIKEDRPKLLYIDMRFPNRAFYKLKGG